MLTRSGWTACFHPWSRASHSASLILTPWICTCLPRSLLWGLSERILCTMPVHRKFIKHLIIMLLTNTVFNCIQLSVIPGTVAHQAPLSMGFSRQECWSGLPFLPPGDLPDPGIEPTFLASPALAGNYFFFFFLPLVLPGKPNNYVNHCYCSLSAKHGRTWKITKSFNGVSTGQERGLKYSSS